MITYTYYLAYGMNTNLDSMKVRCPNAKSLGKVTLQDHRLVFKTFCDVELDLGNEMECALWLITEDCERSLDRLEGYPNFYGKKNVQIEWNGKTISAMIYYMKDLHGFNFPSEYYLKTVVAGYSQHDMNIDAISQALDDLERYKNANYIGV